MTNDSITPSNRSDMATREVPVIEATAGEQESESVSRRSSGVLRELALARWRGLESQVPRPRQRGDNRSSDRN
jgi:hypothetical protein